MKNSFIVVLLFSFLLSCDSEKEECVFVPESAAIAVNLIFEPLQDVFVNIGSKGQLVTLLTEYPVIRDEMRFFEERNTLLTPFLSMSCMRVYRTHTLTHYLVKPIGFSET